VAEILAFVYRTHRYYFFRLKSRRAELQSQQVTELPELGAQDDVSNQSA